MASFVMQFVVNGLLPWWLFSYLVYFCTSYLTKHNNPSPNVWWLALIISFIPFIPMQFGMVEMKFPELEYLTVGLEGAQIATEASIAHASLSGFDIISALALVGYLSVVSLKLVRLARAWHVLKHGLKGAKIIENDVVTDVTTLVSRKDHSPFVFGTWQPQIVLPAYFFSLDVNQRQVLIQHELTHISNKDHITILLWRVLSTLLWINPVVKKMEWQHIRSVEHRCDNDTIKRFNIDKRLYASTLLASLKSSIGQTQFGAKSRAGMAAGTISSSVTEVNPVVQFNSAALCVEDYKMRLNNIVRSNNREKKNQDTHRLLKKWLPAMAVLCCFVVLFKKVKVTDEIDWQHPLETYTVSSSFSSVHKIRHYKPHKGVDYVAPTGSSVRSAADGIVVVADDSTLNPNYGKAVFIQHKGGYQTLYAHLASVQVAAGSWIRAGESVGIIGESGRATGVHLHFEVIKDKQRVNPTELIEN